jgi:hypothetical protein
MLALCMSVVMETLSVHTERNLRLTRSVIESVMANCSCADQMPAFAYTFAQSRVCTVCVQYSKRTEPGNLYDGR